MIDPSQFEFDLITAVLCAQNHITKAQAIDSVSTDSFTSSNSKRAWGAIKSLSDDGEIVDINGVAGRMGRDGDFLWLVDVVQNSAAVESNMIGYIKRVKQCGYLANAKEKVVEALGVIDGLQDVTAVAEAASSIEAILESLSLETSDTRPKHFKEVARDYVQRMDDKLNGKSDHHIVNSNIPELDLHTGGFNITDLIVLAGPSGSGKTEFAIKLKTAIVENGGESLIFSLEMSNEQVVERAIGARSQMPISNLRNPEKLEEFNGMQRVHKALGELIDKNMYLYDQTGLTVQNIVTMARAHKAKHPELKVIFVDHVGLLDLDGSAGSHHLQVGDVSKRLKMLAKELKTPVVMLSQVVGKQINQRPVKDRIPMATDIKDSSRIEEDADLILFTHRQQTHDERAPGIAEIVFGKARHAIKGTKVYFNWVNGHFSATDQSYAHNTMDQYYNAVPEKKVKKF